MKTIEEEFPHDPENCYDWELWDHYKRLRARAVEMERALSEIAKQHLADEMDDHTTEHADWQLEYHACVSVARESFPPAPNLHQPKP
jgi:hypothetical protein